MTRSWMEKLEKIFWVSNEPWVPSESCLKNGMGNPPERLYLRKFSGGLHDMPKIQSVWIRFNLWQVGLKVPLPIAYWGPHTLRLLIWGPKAASGGLTYRTLTLKWSLQRSFFDASFAHCCSKKIKIGKEGIDPNELVMWQRNRCHVMSYA
jgi:hypothetical protein